MYINDPDSYAPKGFALLRTDYEGGKTLHVFHDGAGKELVCVCTPKDANEERAALEAFSKKHA